MTWASGLTPDSRKPSSLEEENVKLVREVQEELPR